VIASLKALPRVPGVAEVLMPGERGARTLAERRPRGIPLPHAIVEELRGVGGRFGVPMFPSAP
jgi:ureidoglycolate dehydrogenase (NAD+)